jgi:hypothetical protein
MKLGRTWEGIERAWIVPASCCTSPACEARKKRLPSRCRFDGAGLFQQAFFSW